MPITKLLEGFRSFRSSYYEESSAYDELVKNGQAPETLVIACSDSRNDPALLMQSAPGDIFVVRNVAAIVPPYQPDTRYHGTSAAIEFAVKGLKVKNIVVLGHALCGGVQALSQQGAQPDPEYEFLSNWVRVGLGTRQRVDEALPDAPPGIRLRALEQAMILTSLNNILSFPWVRERVEQKNLNLYGWYFDMVKGQLLDYDYTQSVFRTVDNRTHAFDFGGTHTGECCIRWSFDGDIDKTLSPKT